VGASARTLEQAVEGSTIGPLPRLDRRSPLSSELTSEFTALSLALVRGHARCGGNWPMRYWLPVLLALATFTTPQQCQAEKKAFVYGVNAYTHLPPLSKALSDADAVGEILREIGFKAEILRDADRSEFDFKWASFLTQLQAGDVVTFFYAGHGLQVDGLNYLIPKDTPDTVTDEAAILGKALNFHQIMEEVQARQPAAAIYILDACRDNPFPERPSGKGQAKSAPTRSTLGQTRGLAVMQSVYGAFVMYSAGPDEAAIDYVRDPRTEVNSLFTRHLLPLVASLNLSLVDIAKRVQVQVEKDASLVGHRQRPAYFDGILGAYYFNQLEGATNPLDPERIEADNVVRLAAFATWDSACKSRPAPVITLTSPPPRFGRIVTRFESFSNPKAHFGTACEKSTQRGIGVYYVIDDAARDSHAVERVEVSVKHWSVAPVTTVKESFDIDLATRFSKRTTSR
jgi:hypothetical protein